MEFMFLKHALSWKIRVLNMNKALLLRLNICSRIRNIALLWQHMMHRMIFLIVLERRERILWHLIRYRWIWYMGIWLRMHIKLEILNMRRLLRIIRLAFFVKKMKLFWSRMYLVMLVRLKFKALLKELLLKQGAFLKNMISLQEKYAFKSRNFP